jgi:hypothetical protein
VWMDPLLNHGLLPTDLMRQSTALWTFPIRTVLPRGPIWKRGCPEPAPIPEASWQSLMARRIWVLTRIRRTCQVVYTIRESADAPLTMRGKHARRSQPLRVVRPPRQSLMPAAECPRLARSLRTAEKVRAAGCIGAKISGASFFSDQYRLSPAI